MKKEVETQTNFEGLFGSITMVCRKHEEDVEMQWINDKEAVCCHCLAEKLNEPVKWIKFMARVWLEKFERSKLKGEEE